MADKSLLQLTPILTQTPCPNHNSTNPNSKVSPYCLLLLHKQYAFRNRKSAYCKLQRCNSFLSLKRRQWFTEWREIVNGHHQRTRNVPIQDHGILFLRLLRKLRRHKTVERRATFVRWTVRAGDAQRRETSLLIDTRMSWSTIHTVTAAPVHRCCFRTAPVSSYQ